MSRPFRTYAELGEVGGGDIVAQVSAQRHRLADRLAGIRHVVAVASGKGGVGKSFVTANLAAALAHRGRRVAVVDADLNGPSIAAMLGVARGPLAVTSAGVQPATTAAGVRVMAMDLLLATPDSPVRWREPDSGAFLWQSTLETGALREFLADTEWGELDYLLVDLPPGTDRIARLLGLVPTPTALLLVTTPSAAAVAVVTRSIRHAREAGLTDVALVSNMDGHTCTECGAATALFTAGAGRALADRTGVPLWGVIPFDAALGSATDQGRPLQLAGSAAATPAGRAVEAVANALERHAGGRHRRAAGTHPPAPPEP